MSESKIQNPGPQRPQPAALTVGALVVDWHEINSQIEQLALQIRAPRDAQEKSAVLIKQMEGQGLQLVGQVQAITKLLDKMGVDPKAYSVEEAVPEGSPVDFEAEPESSEPDFKAEVLDFKEDGPKPLPKSRFRRS